MACLTNQELGEAILITLTKEVLKFHYKLLKKNLMSDEMSANP